MKTFFSLVFNNFLYKIAALFLALIIWGIVQGEEVVELNRTLAINIHLPKGHILKGDNIEEVDVSVRGPRILLGEMITKDRIEGFVSLTEDDLGSVRLRIIKDMIPGWDDRIKLLVHEPAFIELFVDEEFSKNVPVREVLQGAPAEGYLVQKVSITPKSVKITGLKSELKNLKEIVTQPIDISRVQQSKSFDAALQTNGLNNATLESQSVNVKLQVGEAKENRKFKTVAIEITGTDHLAKPRPRFVSIEIQGTPGVLGFVKPEDLRAFIDMSGTAPGRYEREITVKIPPETVLIETKPAKVFVTVSDQKKIN